MVNHIQSRGHCASGLGLGVMLCEGTYPGFPGDVRNASAYPFPIQYEVIEGIHWEVLVHGTKEEREQYLPAIIRAAQKLERMGCRAIVAECGYFLFFQEAVARAVNVPVCLSSLLQIPFMQNTISPDRAIGVVCSSRKKLTENIQYLYDLGLSPQRKIHFYGIMDDHPCPQFQSLWDREDSDLVAQADFDKAEADMIDLCQEFVDQYPDVGSLIFECTGYPPFARAVQDRLPLPVYSWGTLMEYLFSTVVHRSYEGFV